MLTYGRKDEYFGTRILFVYPKCFHDDRFHFSRMRSSHREVGILGPMLRAIDIRYTALMSPAPAYGAIYVHRYTVAKHIWNAFETEAMAALQHGPLKTN